MPHATVPGHAASRELSRCARDGRGGLCWSVARTSRTAARLDDHRGYDSRQIVGRPNDLGANRFEGIAPRSVFLCLDDWQVSYEKELCELVLETTGASGLLVFDHTRRSDSSVARGEHDIARGSESGNVEREHPADTGKLRPA